MPFSVAFARGLLEKDKSAVITIDRLLIDSCLDKPCVLSASSLFPKEWSWIEDYFIRTDLAVIYMKPHAHKQWCRLRVKIHFMKLAYIVTIYESLFDL